MLPFMLQIDETLPGPLDQLALDYLSSRRASLDFFRRVQGLREEDGVIARRLGVSVRVVREWREVARLLR
jgi:hypothetical protein